MLIILSIILVVVGMVCEAMNRRNSGEKIKKLIGTEDYVEEMRDVCDLPDDVASFITNEENGHELKRYINVFIYHVLNYKLNLKGMLNKMIYASDVYRAWTIGLFISAAIIMLINVFVTFILYSSQLSDFEDFRALQKQEQIFQNQAEAILSELHILMVDKYPDYEKEMFSLMSKRELEVYLVRYPELRTSDTFKTQAAAVLNLRQKVYDIALLMETELANMRFRCVCPWILSQCIPDPYDNLNLERN